MHSVMNSMPANILVEVAKFIGSWKNKTVMQGSNVLNTSQTRMTFSLIHMPYECYKRAVNVNPSLFASVQVYYKEKKVMSDELMCHCYMKNKNDCDKVSGGNPTTDE